jgi:hypothetical protein
MKKKLAMSVALLTPVVLTGCVTSEAINERIGYTVNRLQGRSIDEAISALGYPASERQMAGERVYTWAYGGTAIAGGFNGLAVAGVLHCEIQAGTNAGGVILHVSWSGNVGGCENLARTLPAPPRR